MANFSKTIQIPDHIKRALDQKVNKTRKRGEYTSLKRELESIIRKYYKVEL